MENFKYTTAHVFCPLWKLFVSPVMSADLSEQKADSSSHGETRDIRCSVCSQSFSTESQLQRHHREHQANDKVRPTIPGAGAVARLWHSECLIHPLPPSCPSASSLWPVSSDVQRGVQPHPPQVDAHNLQPHLPRVSEEVLARGQPQVPHHAARERGGQVLSNQLNHSTLHETTYSCLSTST